MGAGEGRSRVLIVSDEFDPHVDQMVALLTSYGVDCVRWIQGTFPATSSVTLAAADSAFSCEIAMQERCIDVQTIRSVWYRHPGPPDRPSGVTDEESRFALAEIRSALAGLYRLSGCFWVNHPDRIRSAESKPYQLKLAAELGFRIPRTLITNDPEKVRQFHAANGRQVIYKPLNSGFMLSRERLCYTKLLSNTDLAHIGLIRNAPGIFQEHIPKRLELRVTIIGQDVFATEIHSQDVAEARTDWRRANVEDLPHFPHKLPAEIERRCTDFLQRSGLVYGAMDMILDTNGEYVFLENNPSGQFGWIEGKTGVPLTATLARMLIAGKPEDTTRASR